MLQLQWDQISSEIWSSDVPCCELEWNTDQRAPVIGNDHRRWPWILAHAAPTKCLFPSAISFPVSGLFPLPHFAPPSSAPSLLLSSSQCGLISHQKPPDIFRFESILRGFDCRGLSGLRHQNLLLQTADCYLMDKFAQVHPRVEQLRYPLFSRCCGCGGWLVFHPQI